MIERALKDLRYGTIQMVVHEGKIVRVERLERIRIDENEALTAPRGSKRTTQV